MVIYEKGEVYNMSEVTSGTSANGNQWANMTIVLSIQTSASSFKYLVLKVRTDRIEDVLKFKVGDKVEVGYAIYGNYFDDEKTGERKWFNKVELVNIKADAPQVVQAAPAPAQTRRAQRPAVPAPQTTEPVKDDLPF